VLGVGKQVSPGPPIKKHRIPDKQYRDLANAGLEGDVRQCSPE